MPIKPLGNLLNPNNDGGLGDLIRHARDMGELVSAIQAALPDAEAAAVIAANIRDNGELVILCSSSAWASRLRFETEPMMQAARATGAEVRCCNVRVGRGHV
jgi:hypothetical protein